MKKILPLFLLIWCVYTLSPSTAQSPTDNSDQLPLTDKEIRYIKQQVGEQMFFTGVPLAFSVLHLLLFLFYPRKWENLYYAAFAGFFAALAYTDGYLILGADEFKRLHRILILLSVVFGLRFMYSLFYQRLPRQFVFFFICGVGLGVFALYAPEYAFPFIAMFTLVAFAEVLRVIISAIWKRSDGAWIIGVGAFVLICVGSYEILSDLKILSPLARTKNPAYYASLVLLTSMSVYLARSFAKTHKDLEKRENQLSQLNSELEVRVKKRTEFIREVFGRYLTDEVVENLLSSPEGLSVGGETRKVTILLSDIREFSTLSEGLPPQKVVTLINTHLEVMTDVIQKYGGTIDEFLGDGILVIFGAPIQKSDDAERAVACALEMQLAMDSVNKQNDDNGLPQIAMGIGINTGEVVVGNIGSQKRAKYGVVGSEVNLTARIESFTSGGQILISDTTLKDAGTIVKVGRSMEVEPKGFTEKITVHLVSGIGGQHDLNL